MEAPVGFKLNVTAVPFWYGHLVLSLGHHGKVVLGRTKGLDFARERSGELQLRCASRRELRRWILDTFRK